MVSIFKKGDTAILETPVQFKGLKNGKRSTLVKSFKEKIIQENITGLSLDANELLTILTEVKNGNFDVKMPIHNIGISGKVCDTLNEIISINKR